MSIPLQKTIQMLTIEIRETDMCALFHRDYEWILAYWVVHRLHAVLRILIFIIKSIVRASQHLAVILLEMINLAFMFALI